MRTAHAFATDYLTGFKRCLDLLPLHQIAQAAERILEAYRRDRLVLIMGNGGSAATASHLACDLGKTILGQNISPLRRRFRVMALTDNVPLITAWANDVDYEMIFAQQLQTWAQPGDLAIVISGSGNSPNVCQAAKTARDLGVYTIGLLGFDGGHLRELVDMPIVIPSEHYGYIEDVHTILGHMITAYIRETLDTPSEKSLLSVITTG